MKVLQLHRKASLLRTGHGTGRIRPARSEDKFTIGFLPRMKQCLVAFNTGTVRQLAGYIGRIKEGVVGDCSFWWRQGSMYQI